ncbi:bifunctional (p)ppGpp synthetase/guanosine-3',5'-bis(diphosphate) 3'-pyrophosphohydrolase [Sutterella sp.]|uniref:RelA/SpoT family protein n=1 Tax=Sutterella sp. TaxID=1981025 RepID=UPI0026E0DB28|nr:bifunctional (p)ppGpp synthetase/guanosine-3',5'-bis(diphosphate) 3'-pyrophosphohydrolase [Sutterella sp.]MDO5530534.1 bifunctional (p)ppGpp synthetase/guanosine-3',5'-bis(diphosphate) 3'-pyrophosphohydrolase [Sutterella sp.]
METTENNPAADPGLARSLVEPLYSGRTLSTGEPTLTHADGVAGILRGIRNDPELIAAAYLFSVPKVVQNSDEWITKSFGPTVAGLVKEHGKMNEVSKRARSESPEARAAMQPEALRRMFLAMCIDLRVVLLKLASRLQTLRWFTSTESEGAKEFGEETLAVFAPLANRLGIWQIKWELEDLSLRITRPDEYRHIANELDESREERLEFMYNTVNKVKSLLAEHGIEADISGRPKHIYSIWKKMQRKHLRFDQLFDVRALRIIVGTVEQCYEVLSIVQEHFTIISKEYDDYIANPKPNGYQSLHTVFTDSQGRPIEIQIRTRAMHEFAELGVAAHWRYKEAGNSNGASEAEEQRVAWLRQLLAWRTEVGGDPHQDAHAVEDDHVYCLTPQGRVVELPQGATPVDFAYLVHTQLGHRCRGARVDGAMVPLNTKLKTGQTVEIIAGKTGQPSRDWLNPELGYAASARTRNKVRQWFNAQQQQELLNEGRERLDKELARLGKTAVKLDDLAKRLGFDKVDDLCIAFAKEEITLTALAQAVQPPKPEPEKEPEIVVKGGSSEKKKGKVLVVGMDSLLTQLARCCHPVPPDEIVGYVTRGRGVTIHRADCPNMKNMVEQDHDRLIEVSWGSTIDDAIYPADVLIVAADRPGLMKDVSEVFQREKVHVTGINSMMMKGDQHMRFSVEVRGGDAMRQLLRGLRELPGVLSARRL